jgi:hypothetical protein
MASMKHVESMQSIAGDLEQFVNRGYRAIERQIPGGSNITLIMEKLLSAYVHSERQSSSGYGFSKANRTRDRDASGS